MDIENVLEFLRSEEKRISGEVIEIPVDQVVWKKKVELTEHIVTEFTIYLDALQDLKNQKFSDNITKLRSELQKVLDERSISSFSHYSPDNLAQTSSGEQIIDSFDSKWSNEIAIHIDLLKIILADNYSPPHDNATGLQYHLMAFIIYQKLCGYFFKIYFPGVNERINYAGMALIQIISLKIVEIHKKGKNKEHVQLATDQHIRKGNENKEKIKKILKEYPDHDFLKKKKKDKADRKKINEFYKTARDTTELTTDMGIKIILKKIFKEEIEKNNV